MKIKEAKDHLVETGWTYWQHMGHVIHMNKWLLKIIFISTIHGIHPGIYTNRAPEELSKMLDYQEDIMEDRE